MMWYEQIIRFLLVKVRKEEQELAENFLAEIFLRTTQMLGKDEIELEFYLGVINKLYKQFSGAEDGQVYLKDFAEYFFAAVIVNAKIANDQAIWSNDFIDVLRHKAIYQALNCSINEHSDLTLTQYINKLEKKFLEQINYDISCDLLHIKIILLNIYSSEIMGDFLKNVETVKDIDDLFDKFVRKIAKEKQKIDNHPLIQAINKTKHYLERAFKSDREKGLAAITLANALTKNAEILLREAQKKPIDAKLISTTKACFLETLQAKEFANITKNIADIAYHFVNFTKERNTGEEILENNKEFISSPLILAINELKLYGFKIYQKDEKKGKAAVELADTLIKKAIVLLNESQKIPLNLQKISMLKKDFNRTLHTKDNIINYHRDIFKPIAINIAIALTGIGAIAILGKAVYSTIKNEGFSFNSAFFFAQTKTQQKVNKVESLLTFTP